jgi:uncharacterized protein (TIGR02266 family)
MHGGFSGQIVAIGFNCRVEDDPQNRRSAPRLPAVLRVDYPNLDRFMADYSENISKNGLFIATDRVHQMDDIVEFDLSFPGLLGPMRLKGKVCWIRTADSREGVPGVGVELMFEDEETRRHVERIAESAESLAESRASNAAERRFRILLAEDNEHVREMFSYGMRKLSQSDLADRVTVEVVECTDGADAWQRLDRDHFDMLLVDIYMPVLDGYELIRRIRASQRLKWLPIVAVSAGTESRKEALQHGADIFLAKPVKLTDIVVTVKTLLRLDR